MSPTYLLAMIASAWFLLGFVVGQHVMMWWQR